MNSQIRDQISLLLCVSKLIERILHERLRVNFFSKRDTLPKPIRFSLHSTNDAETEFVQHVIYAIEQKEYMISYMILSTITSFCSNLNIMVSLVQYLTGLKVTYLIMLVGDNLFQIIVSFVMLKIFPVAFPKG